MKAWIRLADGTELQGLSFGYQGASAGELVFNTSMTGYQEIMTDPSYAGQVILFTYPMIGNYGTVASEVESDRVHAKAVIVGTYLKNYSRMEPSQSLDEFLKQNMVVGIYDVDTRYLTKKIRDGGAQNCVVYSEGFKSEAEDAIKKAPDMNGLDLASMVARSEIEVFEERGRYHVGIIDVGCKNNIARELAGLGLKVTFLPPTIKAEEILAMRIDGLLISNGPGDPEPVPHVCDTLKQLFGKIPMFGICLGHQLLALALGGKTYKLKFGHRGANHPVFYHSQEKIEITSQNHGFAVDTKSLVESAGKKYKDFSLSHAHLTDGTLEGFSIPSLGVMAVQYHPEASPGPSDSKYLFKEFLCFIEKFSTR